MSHQYHVYILTNKYHGVIYIGITGNLSRRFYEHRHKILKGFTKTYNLKKLVYAEQFQNPEEAIHREKQLKNWHRDWKINLIEANNPNWDDISSNLL